MNANAYLTLLTEGIHSASIATIAADGFPQTRIIDIMLYDEQGIYFLTAKGKAFYAQLMTQKFIALSAVKGKVSISLRGKIKNIGSKKLDEIFEKNPYMKGIYPGTTREALEVFCLYEARGEYFDISDPEHVRREPIIIGSPPEEKSGYEIGTNCIGCGICSDVCPQNCVDTTQTPAVIDQNHCLHCGRCREICPQNAITALK